MVYQITEVAMMRIGTTEIVLLVLLALLIFGGSRLAGLGKALGTSIRDFKKATTDDDKKPEGEENKTETANAEVKKEEPTNA